MLPDGVIRQAESIRRNWGEAARDRYLALYNPPNYSDPMPKRDRWISNTKHQPKQFTELEAATIRLQHDTGVGARSLAKSYGANHNTIYSIVRRRGAYRNRPKNFTFDY